MTNVAPSSGTDITSIVLGAAFKGKVSNGHTVGAELIVVDARGLGAFTGASSGTCPSRS